MDQDPANEGVLPLTPAQAADSGSSGAAVSSDSEWSDTDKSPVASIVDDDDYETHESCEEVEASDEDLSAFLVDGSVAEQASRLVRDDPCEHKCLKGKEAELGSFLQSVSGMDRYERITSIMTALAVLMQADTITYRRGNGIREKFSYFLPLVGKVCALSFCASYGCTLLTIQRYKTHIRRGEFAAKPHGNKKNKNATVIDARWLIEWFTEFAKEVGDVVPVRVRMKKTIDGTVRKYYSSEQFTFLPAFFTWDRLYDEMRDYVELSRIRRREPGNSTMRKLLSMHCPNIKIRSPRDNACDVCTIYATKMRHGGATSDTSEELGRHTEAAREMRLEYKADLKAASDTHAVVVMDFSQNLTCPSISDTPSMWYFLSLLSVSVFGIYFANDAKQYNYIYDERVSGKGTDQVNSMLYDFLTKNVIARQIRRLTIYADNCGGQNKSNHVIHFLLALVHQCLLDSVDFKFFVHGHTKNACDRGFGQIRNRIARVDCWTVDGVVENVAAAASSSVVTRITLEDNIFKDFKTVLKELYKPLNAVQKYHIFSAHKDNPGVITCKSSPNDDGLSEDLRRKIDKIKTPSSKVSMMFEQYLMPLTPPQPNAEKIDQMHRKVRPFVPLEFQDDPLYAAPTADEAAQSKNTKRARLKRRADMALEAKRVQDEQQNAPSFVEQLEQAMNDIEDTSGLPKAKQSKRFTTKKKARKDSST